MGYILGVYTIKNDTIIANYYEKPVLLTSWGMFEEKYKIINRTTIQSIYYKYLLDSKNTSYKRSNPYRMGAVMHFVPADSLPSSDCWLKEEKWIWRNESDWKAYMDKIEVEKKKRE